MNDKNTGSMYNSIHVRILECLIPSISYPTEVTKRFLGFSNGVPFTFQLIGRSSSYQQVMADKANSPEQTPATSNPSKVDKYRILCAFPDDSEDKSIPEAHALEWFYSFERFRSINPSHTPSFQFSSPPPQHEQQPQLESSTRSLLPPHPRHLLPLGQ